MQLCSFVCAMGKVRGSNSLTSSIQLLLPIKDSKYGKEKSPSIPGWKSTFHKIVVKDDRVLQVAPSYAAHNQCLCLPL